MTDFLDPFVSIVGGSCNTSLGSVSSCSSSLVAFNIGNIPPGTFVSMTFSVTVNGNAPNGYAICNSATIHCPDCVLGDKVVGPVCNGVVATATVTATITTALSATYTETVSPTDTRTSTESMTPSESLTVTATATSTIVAAGRIVAYPNPFSAGLGKPMTIAYSLAANADVRVAIYEAVGGLVWHGAVRSGEPGGRAGNNVATWDGHNDARRIVSTGPYLVVIESGGKRIAGPEWISVVSK